MLLDKNLIDDSCLVPLNEDFLDIILHWRNSYRVRQSMFNIEEIKREDHINWYNKIKSNSVNYYFVYLYKNQPSGFISFNPVEIKHKRTFWGFYKGEETLPREATLYMGFLALQKAFEDFNLNKVYGEVISSNEKSKKYHLNLGFEQEGFLEDHVIRNGKFENVFLYGISKKNWEKTKENIKLNIINRNNK